MCRHTLFTASAMEGILWGEAALKFSLAFKEHLVTELDLKRVKRVILVNRRLRRFNSKFLNFTTNSWKKNIIKNLKMSINWTYLKRKGIF